jgi:nifR3 family TIM-barrel protein
MGISFKIFTMAKAKNSPVAALAPMRDVTTRAFCDLLLRYGEPDFYVTEFLSVHNASEINRSTVEMLENRSSERPIFVQLLGREPAAFARVARLLPQYGVAGIDVNFGCPAPKVHRKGAGGGLLNEPEAMGAILSEIRCSTILPVSAKIRIGVEDDSKFDQIIAVLAQHDLAHVAVHARTVRDLYREGVNYDYARRAKEALGCSVLANGDINSAQQAHAVVEQTGCDGVMIGRAALRNPFIFSQIRSCQSEVLPKFSDIYLYIMQLVAIIGRRTTDERKQVGNLKKYLNFIGQCVDMDGEFLRHAQRATGREALVRVIDTHINQRRDEHWHGVPYCGVKARQNCE